MVSVSNRPVQLKRSQLNPAIQAERRQHAESRPKSIWDFAIADRAPEAQLERFDAGVADLHGKVSDANTSLYGDPARSEFKTAPLRGRGREPRVLNPAVQAERRRGGKGATIWDFGVAGHAPESQLAEFDATVGRVHDEVAYANADLYGDALPAHLAPRTRAPEAAHLAPRTRAPEAARVQMKTDADTGLDTDEIQTAAARGVQGRGGRLPHFDKIQAAFGDHDLSDVVAHVGGSAREASDAMGAEAYATGNAIAFRDTPSLHTAAHEAAHIVQQRAGVSLQGGVGQAGDTYERQADAIADAVVAGRSVESLLGSRDSSAQGSSVQRKGGNSAATEIEFDLSGIVKEGAVSVSAASSRKVPIVNIPASRLDHILPGLFLQPQLEWGIKTSSQITAKANETSKSFSVSVEISGGVKIGLGVEGVNAGLQADINLSLGSVSAKATRQNGRWQLAFELSHAKVEGALSLVWEAGNIKGAMKVASLPIGQFTAFKVDNNRVTKKQWEWSQEILDFLRKFAREVRLRAPEKLLDHGVKPGPNSHHPMQ